MVEHSKRRRGRPSKADQAANQVPTDEHATDQADDQVASTAAEPAADVPPTTEAPPTTEPGQPITQIDVPATYCYHVEIRLARTARPEAGWQRRRFRHLDIGALTDEQSQALEALYNGLFNTQQSTANGQPVTAQRHAVKWLLDQVYEQLTANCPPAG